MSSVAGGATSGLSARYAQLLVVRKVSAPLRATGALSAWLRDLGVEASSFLRWHDDATAVIQFPSARAAAAALPLISGAGRLGEVFRKAHEASHPQGALPALDAVEDDDDDEDALSASLATSSLARSAAAEPAGRRDFSVASRLIRGALGSQRHVVGGIAPANSSAALATSGAGYLRPVAPLPERPAAGSWRRNADVGAGGAPAAGGVSEAERTAGAVASVDAPHPTARGRGAASGRAATNAPWRRELSVGDASAPRAASRPSAAPEQTTRPSAAPAAPLVEPTRPAVAPPPLAAAASSGGGTRRSLKATTAVFFSSAAPEFVSLADAFSSAAPEFVSLADSAPPPTDSAVLPALSKKKRGASAGGARSAGGGGGGGASGDSNAGSSAGKGGGAGGGAAVAARAEEPPPMVVKGRGARARA
jgi:hypothetical protein